jgi:CrcB protein
VSFVKRIAPGAAYPWGTLAVNVVGCLLIGLAVGLIDAKSPLLASAESKAFLIVGILGSFTTFSTFGHESVVLATDGPPIAAVLNVVMHVVLGFGAVLLGSALARVLAA